MAAPRRAAIAAAALLLFLPAAFPMAAAAPPAAPTATAPGSTTESAATEISSVETFSWTAVANAAGYIVYVSKSPYGGSNVIMTRFATGTSTTITKADINAAGGSATQFRWGVTAYNSVGEESVQSNVRYFKATPQPNQAPTCARGAPAEFSTATVGQTVTFRADCTDPEGQWYAAAWAADDHGSSSQFYSGSPSTSWSPSKAYSWSTPGAKLVGMGTVDTAGGQSNQVWWTVTVQEPNVAPNTPSNPTPSTGASGVDRNADGSWSGGDPNAGQTVTSTVRFGTSPNPSTVQCTTTSTTCDFGTMAAGTTYYWRVSASDGSLTRDGPVWSFTTAAPVPLPPNTPSNPSPADGATEVAVDADGSWTGGDPDSGTVTYTVKLGTTNPPTATRCTTTSTTCDFGPMVAATGYFWQVSASDGTATTNGPVWRFTTAATPPVNRAPHAPSDPTPAPSAEDVAIDADGSWTGGDPDGQTVTYTVLLGTSSPPSALRCTTQATTCDFGTMAPGTTYYWQVRASDGTLTTPGPVWSFRTAGASGDCSAATQTRTGVITVGTPLAGNGGQGINERGGSNVPVIVDGQTITLSHAATGCERVTLTFSSVGGADLDVHFLDAARQPIPYDECSLGRTNEDEECLAPAGARYAVVAGVFGANVGFTFHYRHH